MKCFLWSSWGDLHFLARQLQADGHEVQLYIDNPQAQKVGDGLVPRPRAAAPASGATVLLDVAGKGALGRSLRPRHPVIGGNAIDRDLEIDRTKATALFKEHGLKVPETHSFRTIAQGRAFLATHPGRWFFKPNGQLPTADTYDGETAEGLSRWMEWAGKQVANLSSFELQKAVKGTEVSVEGWFDGTRFVPPFNATFEVKRFLSGDRGPRTGGEANFVWALHGETPELAKRTVLKMEPVLRQAGYVGPFDLNSIIDDDGTPYVLEASPRIGIPAFQAYSVLCRDLGKQLDSFARGKLDHWDLVMDKFALALVVSVPPYPVEREDVATQGAVAKKKAGLPLDRRLLENPRRYLLDDVQRGPEGIPVLAGRDGKVCTLAAVGTSAPMLRSELVQRADALDVPNAQFRPDPVTRAEMDWAALRRLGLLSEKDSPLAKQTTRSTTASRASAKDEAA